MEKEDLRLECLRLAVTRTPDHHESLIRAENYFDFVLKKSELPPIEPKEVSKDTFKGKKGENVKNLL